MALTVGELNGYLRLDDGSFERALDSAGAKFQRFKSRIDVQLQELEHSLKGMAAEVTITADTKPAERDVRAFVRRMNALRINLNVNVSIVQALQRLNEIQDRVREVSRLRANVSVRAESADTIAALHAITTLIDRIDRARPTVTVSASTARAEAALRHLDAAQRDAGNNRGFLHLEGDLAGFGSAAAGAAGALAGVAGKASLIAAALGAAIPVAAGLVATLVNIAPAAAIGATAVFSLAAAFGAIKLGTGGLGSAFKAAFAPAASGGGGAAKAANQAASAQRNLKRAVSDAAYANRQAAQQVASAERDLTAAQRSALATQRAINDARKEATRDLQDLNDSLIDAQNQEKEADYAVKDAAKALAQAQATGDPDAIGRAQLAYNEAVQALAEQRTQVQRLTVDTKDANKAGVEGSKTVTDAKQAEADAVQDVRDKTLALSNAQIQQARTAQQGADAILQAKEALAQAGAAAGGGAGGVNAFAAAMAKLSPNARAFVMQVIALKGAWTAMQQAVQNKLFEGLAGTLKTTAAAVLPVLRKGLVDSAGALNLMAKGAMNAAAGVAKDGTLGKALASASGGLHNLAGIPGIVVKALTQLAAAAGPAFQSLTAAAGRGAASIGAKLDAAFKSGRLRAAIDQAVALIKQMGVIAGNVFRIIGALFAPANASGGGFLTTLENITRALADGLGTPAAQEGLRALYQTMGLIARTVGPLLVQAIQAVAPVLVALAPPVQRLVTALGTALGPIIDALGPVLVVAAQAFGQLLDGFQPVIAALPQLMGPITQLVSGLASSAPTVGLLVAAFNPFLGILILLAPVLDKLIGPIGTLITALTPLIDAVAVFAGQLAQALVPVVAALSPVLGALADTVGAVLLALSPLLPVIGDLIAAILPVFTPILKALSGVFLKLAGPIAQIATALGTALAPVIEGLSEVIDDLAAKYLATLMGVFDQLIPLVPVLTPVLIQLGLSIGQILAAVAPLLPQMMMLGVTLVTQLLPAIIPLIPPLAQLTTLLLILATDVITKVVVPAFGGLISFFSGLMKAFKPALDAVTWLTTAISKAFEWLADHLVGHSVIPDMVRSIVQWFAGLPGKAVAALGNIASRLGKVISGATDGMIRATMIGLRAVVSWIGDLPGRARDALGNLGGYLYKSGQALLSGFISGISSMLKPVKNAVSNVLGAARGLFPHSPAKEGPFSGRGWVSYSGASIGSAFSAALLSQRGQVGAAATSLMQSAHDGLAVPGTPTGALIALPSRSRAAGYGGTGGYGGGVVEHRLIIDPRGGTDDLMKVVKKWIRIQAPAGDGSVQYALGQ